MRSRFLWIAICLILTIFVNRIGASDSTNSAEPPKKKGFAQISTFKLDELSWVQREAPGDSPFKSEKPRYTWWVLGDGKKSVMLVAWDESGGTGTGYDTLYADLNYNGSLADEGEKIVGTPKLGRGKKPTGCMSFVVNAKEADGNATFTLSMIMSKAKPKRGQKTPPLEGYTFFHWWSSFSISRPNPKDARRPHRVRVGILPGNVQIRAGFDAKTAPIYRLGGPAIPQPQNITRVGRKRQTTTYYPGDSMGTWKAGQTASLSYAVSMFGSNLNTYLRFWQSNPPGGRPQTFLRVKGKEGKILEDIAFHGGCG